MFQFGIRSRQSELQFYIKVKRSEYLLLMMCYYTHYYSNEVSISIYFKFGLERDRVVSCYNTTGFIYFNEKKKKKHLLKR